MPNSMTFCTGEGCMMKRHCARNNRTPKDEVGHTGIADKARYEVFQNPPFLASTPEEQGCNYFWPEAFGEMIRQEIPKDMVLMMGPPIPDYVPPDLPGYEPTPTPDRDLEVTIHNKADGSTTFSTEGSLLETPLTGPTIPEVLSEVGSPVIVGAKEPATVIKGKLMEPDFTIRGRDRGGPEIIMEWIKRAGAYGSTPDKLRAAFEVYLAMIKWQRDNPELVKTPD